MKKLRSGLALLGLAVSILGIIALTSLSGGILRSMRDTFGMVQGILVLQKNVPSPVLSNLPLADGETIEKDPEVRSAVPEIFFPAFLVEGRDYRNTAMTEFLAVMGADMAKRRALADGGLHARKLTRGRAIDPGDGTAVMISERVAKIHGKDLGDTLAVNGATFEVVGVFKTGSIFFDNTLVVRIEEARRMSMKREDLVSVFYVEAKDPAETAAVALRIREALPDADARQTSEWAEEIATLITDVDVFLFAISLVAVAVGGIGILNTMLMSVMERYPEFGVLRANGWTRGDVAHLVILESLLIGAAGGIAGCALGASGVFIAGKFLPLPPRVTPGWLLASFAMAVFLGAIGGVYPAYRASRLDPIEAIRHG